jgi:hypothetical protein
MALRIGSDHMILQQQLLAAAADLFLNNQRYQQKI